MRDPAHGEGNCRGSLCYNQEGILLQTASAAWPSLALRASNVEKQHGLCEPCYNQKCSHARNVAKKTLPEYVATFVGGHILGNLIPKNVAVPENVADTDPSGNVATSPENVAAVNPTGNVFYVLDWVLSCFR